MFKKYYTYLTTINIFWFIFLVALIKSVLFSHIGFGLLDEGESLSNAMRILKGDLPYKDFFAIFPPLDNYIFALIFKFLGPSILLPRIVMSFIFSFTPAFIFLLLIKYTNKFLSGTYALLLIFLDLNVERLYFFTPIVISLYVLENNPFVAGTLLGIASLIRFDIPGTFLIGSVVIIFLTQTKNKIFFVKKLNIVFKLGVGYLIPILICLLWMIKKNIINLFFKATFVDSIVITKLHHLPFPSMLAVLPKNLDINSFLISYQAFYANLNLVIYLVFFMYLITHLKDVLKTPLFIGLMITGLLSFPYVFGRSDTGHIVKGTLPVLFLSPFLLQKLKLDFLRMGLFSALIIIFMANFIQSIYWVRFNDTKIQIASYYLKVNSKSIPNSTTASVLTLVETSKFLSGIDKDEKIVALPYMAGLYFLNNKIPPNKFNNVLAGFITTKEEEQKFIEDIKNVKKVVYARNSGPKMQHNKLYEYNPLIDEYIMKNYKIVQKTPDGWFLMEKNE